MNKLFRFLVSRLILMADTYFLNRSIGYRETNPATHWLMEEAVDIYERIWGKECFRPEYSPDIAVFTDEIDYLGMVFKKSLVPDVLYAYLSDIYRQNSKPALNAAIDKFVKENPGYCLKLVLGHLAGKIKSFLLPFKRYVFDKISKTNTAGELEGHIRDVRDIYKNKPLGLFLGLDLEFQLNFVTPILEEFAASGFNVLYLQKSHSKESLEKQKWGYQWKTGLSRGIGVLGDGKTRADFRKVKEALIDKIRKAGTRPIYKRAVIKNIDTVLKEYYVCRYFYNKVIPDLNISFVFCLPDKLLSQRAFLVLTRGRSIPSFTYEPVFSTSAKVMNEWSYLVNRVLLTCNVQKRTLSAMGFPEARIKVVGSILADFQTGLKGARQPSDGRVNILMLTKATHKSFDNTPLIKATVESLSDCGRPFTLYIKPHPADRSHYRYFKEKYPENIELTGKNTPLCDIIPYIDLIICCGNSYSIFECLPSGRKIFSIDTACTSDNDFLRSGLLAEIISYYEDIGQFQYGLKKFVKNSDFNNMDIPPGVVEDFFYALDGKTARRIREFTMESCCSGFQCKSIAC